MNCEQRTMGVGERASARSQQGSACVDRGGRETVGWYCDGSWYVLDDGGYDWYKQVVVAWYDVPSPTMEQIANWM